MEINFTLLLPRDALTVPVVRRVLKQSLRTLGVADVCLQDIEVALTEACTNVLDHATAGDEYEVVARLAGDICSIEVLDTGRGFDPDRLSAGADPTAEEGRGIQLIRALVDKVHFRSREEVGTVVHLEKQLQFEADSPVQLLADRGPDTMALDLTKAGPALREREDALDRPSPPAAPSPPD